MSIDMQEALKYTDVFHTERIIEKGCQYAILYKRYIRIHKNVRDMVAYDKEVTQAFQETHPKYVQVVDLQNARAKVTRVVKYTREYMKEPNLIPPVHTHVINVPKWCLAAWKVIKPLLSAETSQKIALHSTNWAEDDAVLQSIGSSAAHNIARICARAEAIDLTDKALDSQGEDE